MKKRNLIIILSVVLIALIALFGTLHITSKSGDENNTDKAPSQSQNNDAQKEQGINITVKLVLADKTETVFKIKTETTTLADALLEKKLISKEEYDAGFYSTINGVRADYTLDKTWWCFYINGKEALTGANEIILNEGDSFEIVQTPA